jgi:hypothetical protein
MCLCFDIEDDYLHPITYATKRLEFQLEEHIKKDKTISDELSERLRTTKFADWKYEQEVRMFLSTSITYRENGLEFYEFDPYLKLFKVILGPRCRVPTDEVEAAIREKDSVLVLESRLAFQSFRVLTKTKSSNP